LNLAEELRTLPEVEAINRVRLNKIDYQENEIVLGVLDLHVTIEQHEEASVSKYYVDGSLKEATKILNSREPAALVSENFSQKYGPKTGDRVVLNTPKGERSFKVAGVLIDYTSEQGVVYLDWSEYLPLWEDPLADSFNLYLKPNTNPNELREKVLERWGNEYPIIVTTKKEFHQEATTILDQSFGAARALQMVALIIALVGIVNTLLAAVLERTREIGVLRALGATRSQCRRMILMEAMMMGILGSAIGIASGSTTAAIDLFVTTRQMLGMTIHYYFPIGLPVTAISTSILTAVVAGLYPAYRATRIDPIEAMRYE
jgi:putative ABC transport system permease protein